MANLMVNIIYVILALIFVVLLDLKYFKNDFWKMLMVNIIIFLAFAAFYYLFLSNL
jgi:hypothetical protein